MSQSQTGFPEAQDAQADEARRAYRHGLIERFNTIDYQKRMRLNPEHVPGTFEWFRNHKAFRKWIDDDSEHLLLVSADPGCGKSTLSRCLVENILPHQKPDATIAYFFFRDNAEQGTFANGLCAILHQVLQHNHRVVDDLQDQIKRTRTGVTKPTSELWTLLTQAATNAASNEILCVLDALDECKDEDLQTFVKVLLSMRSKSADTIKFKLRFLATTRGYPKILNQFSELNPDCIHLSGDSTEERDQIRNEIELVLDHNLKAFSRKNGLSIQRQATIRDALLRQGSEQKTYLWSRLVFEVLEQSYNKLAESERLIQNPPSSVHQVYEELLQSVSEGDMGDVRVLLQLLLAAYRPLTLQEMNIAVHVRDHIGASSEEDIGLKSDDDFSQWLARTCGSFVTIHDEKIYLIHQTAKEFLMAPKSSTDVNTRTWHHSMNEYKVHSTMAESCIAYLSLHQFQNWPILAEAFAKDPFSVVFEAPSSNCGFWDYTINEWTRHFRNCQMSRGKTIADISDIFVPAYLSFFDMGWVEIWRESDAYKRRYRNYHNRRGYLPRRMADQDTVKSIAVAFDHARLLEHTMQKKSELQPIDRGQRQDGHASLLVEAARAGAIWCTKLILGYAFVVAPNREGDNPRACHKALFFGHAETAKLLLEKGANPNIGNWINTTALHSASIFGYTAIVELLLAKGADVDIRSKDDQTALYLASKWGRTEIVKLLLANGADINARTESGQTALQVASQEGHAEICELLLEPRPLVETITEQSTAEPEQPNDTVIAADQSERNAFPNLPSLVDKIFEALGLSYYNEPPLPQGMQRVRWTCDHCGIKLFDDFEIPAPTALNDPPTELQDNDSSPNGALFRCKVLIGQLAHEAWRFILTNIRRGQKTRDHNDHELPVYAESASQEQRPPATPDELYLLFIQRAPKPDEVVHPEKSKLLAFTEIQS
ncbi:hypothetical protein PFICI_04338 [Pestalotiopsis fici W106-1]|uniref:Nephrocystin 3-like N-terminal domain-containing protein n=1 Tax=Pestalotiopsis fici (strain W106-1 / CGMCC3.15140) TaxID=1229662 RepID=W3XAL5_PESFW|nr:uncharacterized protein PFICI_04338 [Pestalotiopsis fici W106-1]ETS82462.1 hypothetical protein PFICI_04338 [Pestalotiopsis fici W106-1]